MLRISSDDIVISQCKKEAAVTCCKDAITQDGVVFTSTYVGNVLTLEIDAAGRSGGWAGASAIDALALKTIGGFSGVSMSSSTGAAWSLAPSELFARGCGAGKTKSASADMTRLCYSGAGVALADNMVFTFSFTGSPALSAPHLKVHFVDAAGSKVGSLLSLDFPWQAASVPVAPGGQGGTLPVDVRDEDESEVPEPRTPGLMTAGLITLAVARRRRRK